jgi:hypothetical protein
LLKQNRNKEKSAYSNRRYLPNVGVRTGFSQPARKKLVLFHGQEDVGVQYIRVFLLPYCKVEKKWHYIAWANWSLHTV